MIAFGSGFFGIFLIIFRAASRIRMPTAILMPRKAWAIQVMARKSSRKREMAKTMQKLGSTMPNVAASAPAKPFCRKPTKVAQLMAIGPGVDSAMTVISIISSWLIQCFCSTQACSIREIMA